MNFRRRTGFIVIFQCLMNISFEFVQATTQKDLTHLFPQYTDLSPCPCDLTEEKCDTTCSCDQDCPDGLTELVSPEKDVRLRPGNCSHPLMSQVQLDWANVFCIVSNNTPYLGRFFEPSSGSVLSSKAMYDHVVTEIKPEGHTQFENDEGQFIEPATFHQYLDGKSIKTLYDDSKGIFGVLQLPHQTMSGQCLFTPVRFLRPSESSCVHRLSPTVCNRGRNTPLDYQVYLIDHSVEISTVPEVLEAADNGKKADITVRYFKTDDARAYLKLHGYPGNGEDNHRRQRSIDRIPLDDLEIFPNIQAQIHYDEETSTCQNVVLAVHYHISWSSTSISNTEVIILLGNITAREFGSIHNQSEVSSQNSFIELTQQFKVSYEHANSEEKIKKSGEPGYERHLPLVGGMITNETGEETVEQSDLLRWNSGDTSHCSRATLVPINFGEDLQSSCMLKLSKQNFSDCEKLQEEVSSVFETLLPSNSVAKGGNLNITRSEFVRMIIDEKNETTNETSDFCRVNSKIHLSVLYTEFEPGSEHPIFRVNAVRKSWTSEHWGWMCYGQCKKFQPFPLEISVSFAKIPIVWENQNKSRFWIQQENANCGGDMCWNELFHPFTSQKTGEDIAYVTRWGIAFTIVGCLTLYVTKAFW